MDDLKKRALGADALPRSGDGSKTAEFQFERPDWVLFRSVGTLSQKAGVPQTWLRRLVLKELTDNALDSGAVSIQHGALPDEGGLTRFFVEDDGPGLDGTPEDIARLFSINRPLMSSKLLRLPRRGALGNGLRVAVGAVAASQGTLTLWTRNRRLTLRPRDDGTTAVEAAAVDFPRGTRIEIGFGPALPADSATLTWARLALTLAHQGTVYGGRSSPWWYDAESFFEVLQAAGPRPVRDLIATLDGCTGAKAGTIAARFRNTPCCVLSREEASTLLALARANAKPVRPERLGSVGPEVPTLPPFHAVARGTVKTGAVAPKAEIPFVAEAWAHLDRDGAPDSKHTIRVCINRTPVTGEVVAYSAKDKNAHKLVIRGCGINYWFQIARGTLDLVLNITTPYCPITTDGKEPDLRPFIGVVEDAVQKAVNKARRATGKRGGREEGVNQKAIILRHLDDGIAQASGDGVYPYTQRQLFYTLRPHVIEALGVEPTWKHFTGIITDYEHENGDIAGMYRDPRGTLYHPHLRQDIPLGTKAVEDYERPTWSFNKILYVEKEGFSEALKAAQWPERHDCAVVSSKGYTTRAVRDLFDLLGDGDEPIQVFCVHDADAHGSMIFQTLQEATKARPRRRVEIVNLGLEPWEAIEMGLPVEPIEAEKQGQPVAAYVSRAPQGATWVRWLNDKRIELNAMTTPQFLDWLDDKMADYGDGKLIPPDAVLSETIATRLEAHLRGIIAERILRNAGLERQVAEALAAIDCPTAETLEQDLVDWFEDNGERPWRDFVDQVARDLAETG